MKNINGIFVIVICVTLCYGSPIKDQLRRERRQLKDMNSSSSVMQSRQTAQPINLLPANGFAQNIYPQLPFNNGLYPLPSNFYGGDIYSNAIVPVPNVPQNVDVNQLQALINYANSPGLVSQNTMPQQGFLQPTFPQPQPPVGSLTPFPQYFG